jgi:hypothetical protein
MYVFNHKIKIMKKSIQLITAFALILSFTFVSCKKTDTNDNSSDYTAELSAHSDDQARFAEENDAMDNDANLFIDNYPAFNGVIGGVNNLPCHATHTLDSSNGIRRITITYNGLDCRGLTYRTGEVVLSMPVSQHWRDMGAVLTITTNNLHITRVRDNRSITINGVKTITNVTGGRLANLPALGTITHAIASPGMTVTFDNNTQRVWRIAKQRDFTYNGSIVITTTGTHVDGTTTGISEWGMNRFGHQFVTAITAPLVIREDCDFRLVSGQVTHSKLVASTVVTFGLDVNGNPTGCPAPGDFYYMKIVWTGANGVIRTVIQRY